MKKIRKNVDFGVVFGSQNDEKSRKNGIDKRVFLLLRFSFVFFQFFTIFVRFWEVQKSKKNRKNRVRDAFGARFAFFFDFGSDFGTTLRDFGWILDGFWMDLGKVLGGFLQLFRRI